MEEPVGAVVDGKLYIVQGLTDGGFQPMGVVYVFDPATNIVDEEERDARAPRASWNDRRAER